MIEIRVHGVADTEAELRSLLRWLKADDEIGPRVHGMLGSSAPADPEHMGALLDVISLTVGNGLAAAQFALSIHQWRAARRAPTGVVLRRGGVEIEVHGADPAVLRGVTALLAEEERAGDGGTA
ncbi:hypothetical protein N4G70_24940 [Streptomyces sp. ASQP_92]|uniref:effector-associated constant component EACC1 n=1 Tax=Streptomyces sp. ASQP_92 TaxID=2979116 RepID=UPI0021C0DA39|nr:hypothetical protein [Streptomyces sp. ASQP_92]MCT9092097.1 hypothetical protein [Streptomyces sp. ASQP_92]